jgi:EPS-associated MarR family transcriptional regulator
VTQRELSQKLDVSLGRVNHCLNALTEIGFIKVENFKASSTKGRHAYILAPSGIAEKAALTGRFLVRKFRDMTTWGPRLRLFGMSLRLLTGRIRDSLRLSGFFGGGCLALELSPLRP